jgi:hypothetical protein
MHQHLIMKTFKVYIFLCTNIPLTCDHISSK